MYVSEVNIMPVKPQGGLVAFASVVINESVYLSSIAIYTRPDGSYRLLYPTKKLGERILNLFHPISREASKQIEDAIFKKCYEIFERNHHGPEEIHLQG
jgi:DNA-binding cell septation regulator SpoVG